MKDIKDFLRSNSLRPTKQRVLIAEYLFDGENKHVTAEKLSNELNKLISTLIWKRIVQERLL